MFINCRILGVMCILHNVLRILHSLRGTCIEASDGYRKHDMYLNYYYKQDHLRNSSWIFAGIWIMSELI